MTAILGFTDVALFRDYAERIRRFLKLSANQKCRQVFDLVQSLTLGEQGLHVDLSHPKGQFGGDAVSLVRDTIPLPGIRLLKNRAHLKRLYQDEELSIRAIGRRIDVAPSTVSDYLHRYNLIDDDREPPTRPQHVPFGYDFKNGKLVQNKKEQQVIRQVRQLRAAGLTYRDIAAHLIESWCRQNAVEYGSRRGCATPDATFRQAVSERLKPGLCAQRIPPCVRTQPHLQLSPTAEREG